MFKQPSVFQFDNGPEFKRDVTKLTGKHNIGVRRATAKYKYIYIAFVEIFNKLFTKTFFEPMNAQDIQDIIFDSIFHPDEICRNQKIQATNFIWSENAYRLNRIVKGSVNSVL